MIRHQKGVFCTILKMCLFKLFFSQFSHLLRKIVRITQLLHIIKILNREETNQFFFDIFSGFSRDKQTNRRSVKVGEVAENKSS